MLINLFVFNVNVFVKSCLDSTWMAGLQGISGSAGSLPALALMRACGATSPKKSVTLNSRIELSTREY